MSKLHLEALIFCLAWAALAMAGGALAGIWTGVFLSLGLLLVLMPMSATILTRTEDFTLERQVRWAILAIAALGLVISIQLRP